MIERGGDAYVVNTASGAGLVVIGSGVMYSTAKFGVVGLSEGLRNALARRGIGVSVLCPGFVATDIGDNSAALSPTVVAARPARTPAAAEAFKSKGLPPDAVGDLVLAAIRANQLYIYTDDEIGPHLERRHEALMGALTAAPSRAARP